jgi:uncharacterized protein (TIGR02145 family)
MNILNFNIFRRSHPFVKIFLLLFCIFSLHQEMFSSTIHEDMSACGYEMQNNYSDTAGCGNLAPDTLQNIARFDYSANGSDYYYVRLSLFQSEFERLYFYQEAGARGIYITDKTEFTSDSALFRTDNFQDQAMLEFSDLYRRTEEAASITSATAKNDFVEASPMHKAFASQQPGFPDAPFGGETPLDCSTAQVACSANVYSFPAGTFGNAPAPDPSGYPNYGCLASRPCPVWYFMQVGVAGNIIINISKTGGPTSNDVDFICWGPNASMTEGCATGLTGTCGTSGNPCCNNTSPGCVYPKGNITDCSYDGSATETCHILNAQVGEIYILLITNFSGQVGTITFSQTGGTGVTNCNIVHECSVIAITANPSICNEATNTFSVFGNIEFSNPSPTGLLTITDNTAVPPVSQSFPPPFVSPKAYNLQDIPCDGLVHSITAVFSDSLDCTLTQQFTAPPAPCPQALISGGGTICNNGTQQATVSVAFPAGTPPYTFVYAINGINQAPVTHNTTTPYQISTTTPGVYTLVSISTISCTAGSVSGSATVAVNPVPTATISGTTAVCQGAAPPDIAFTGGAATPPYKFTYNINGGANQTVTTTSGNSVTVPAPTNATGTFVYNLISVEEGSSSACTQQQTGSATITVNPKPTASISGTTTVCRNSTDPLITFTGGAGTPPYTFTYNLDGGTNQTVATTSGNSVTVTAPASTAGTFTYNLVSVQDAGSTTCSQLQTGSAIITVNPLPTAAISGTTTICQNSAAPGITFTGGGGTPPYTFTYNLNGGSNQTVTTTSGNTVTVTAPTAAAGTFIYNLVSVQNASSTTCSQLQGGSATVIVNPLPAAAIAGATSVCQNSASPDVTFTGSSATPPYTFTYSINGGNDLTVTTTSGNSATVAVPTDVAGTFIYSLIKVQDAGSTTCSQLQNGTATVTVHPLPTAAIEGTTTVCQNSTAPGITFTGGSATAPYTFTYNINGGTNQTVTTASGNSVTISAPTNITGTFIYNLVSVQEASSTTCSQLQAGSATITVNPLPTATISGTTTICQNSAAPDITFTGGSATAPYTFTYNINGGSSQTVTTSSGNSVTVQAPTNAAGTFTYNLVSVQDASSTLCSQLQPGSATVTVNPLPTAAISGTSTVCLDSPAQLITFTGGGSTPPYTFTYNVNGGTSQTVTTTSGSSVTVPAPANVAGTFAYNLVKVQDASSTTCSQLQTGSATITINPLPIPAISGPPAICVNTSGTYSTAADMTGYAWTVSPGGIITGGGSTNSITVLWATTGAKTITVNYNDANGCTAHAATAYPVTVNTRPVPTIAGASSICTGIPVTYTTESSMLSYSWTVSAGGTITAGGQATDATVTVNWITAGPNSVSVNYVVGTGCTAQNPTQYNVTVNPSPTPTITSPANPICAASSTTYTTQPGMSGYTWTISPGGSIISGSNSNILTVLWDKDGVQNVTINYTNAFSCTALTPVNYNLLVNPLPVTTITEAPVPVCQSIPHIYEVPADPACSFTWSVIPAANGIINAGQGTRTVTIDWQTSGNAAVAVTGTNTATSCLSSSTLPVVVKPKPVPVLTPCFDLVTTPNAKKIILRGGSPSLPGQGVFSGSRISLNNLSGYYEFDPFGAPAGSYNITYTYTNTFGCPASTGPVTITVQNNDFSCGGNLTDVRDGKIYKTAFLSGRCWMTENLNYGTAMVTAPVPPQSDNCLAEKYCAPSDAGCSTYGGLYQWDELMDYSVVPGTKGLCPPGWHVPTETELQSLIDNLITGIGSPDANALAGSTLKDLLITGGFHAVLGGLNYLDNSWAFNSGSKTATIYWTSSTGGTERAVSRGLNAMTSGVSKYISSRGNGFAARCVKD